MSIYYETLQYVDGGGATQEVAFQNLSANGAAVSTELIPRTHDISEFVITLPQPPETAINIPFKSRCKIYAGRTSSSGANNSFSGGSIIFQGRRTNREKGDASGTKVSSMIVLSDAMWDLKHATYAMPWQYISGGTISAPTYSTFAWPDVVLFAANPAGQLQANGSYAAYSPAPVNGLISTWQQILACVNYALSFYSGTDAIQLQLGSTPEFTPTYLNTYPVRSLKCLAILQLCLRPHPGVYMEIDYTTSTPTLHFRNRAAMTTVTLPYKSTLGDGTVHVASDIECLSELVPDRVAIFYKINGTYNGQPVLNYASDIYPSGAGPSLLSDDYSVDITGETQQVTLVNFTSYAFDPTNLDLWRKKVPSLQQVSGGGQIPNDGSSGALALLDTTINGSLSTHPNGIQVVTEAKPPVAINLSTYLYYTDCPVYSWMTLSGGTAASVIAADVEGVFSYSKTTGGALNLTPKVGNHPHHMRLKLTNAPSGQYYLKQVLNTGESIITGLAQSVFTELGGDTGSGPSPQWKLRHEILQVAASATAVPTLIKPGKHVVNLSGGASDWTTMNAVPENVTIKLFRVLVNLNDGSGTSEWRLAAQHVINCGPANHLEPAYRTQLFNLFSNRNLRRIDAKQQLNGLISSAQVDLSGEAARENSVPANADFQKQMVYGPDAVQSGLSNVITHDSTTGQITVAKQPTAGGAAYTTGLIAPEYSGSGAPTSSTLAAGAYYRVGDKYIDVTSSTTPVQWRCMTDGDKTSSVWAQLGGGGGAGGNTWL